MEKVDFTKLNSANITAENSVDTERVYDITANVNISGQNVNSIDGGSVKDTGGKQLATFSRWGGNQLNINFMNVDAMEMCSIINEVNAFIVNVVDKVATESINI